MNPLSTTYVFDKRFEQVTDSVTQTIHNSDVIEPWKLTGCIGYSLNQIMLNKVTDYGSL